MHLIFSFRPTSEFPHPLSRVKQPAGYRVSFFVSFNSFELCLLLYSLPSLPFSSISLFTSFNDCKCVNLQLSYQIVDSMIWLGIRDLINDLRKKKLKLRPVTYLSGTQGSESNIPHGYIWSPHLVPKPKGIPSCTYICYRYFSLILW